MAPDTSGGERSPPGGSPLGFDKFYLTSFELLGAAAWLTVGDRELADDAFNEAMKRTRRGWRHIPKSASPAALVFLRSFMLVDQPPEPLVRSGPVDLEMIIAELPIGQRAALVCAHFLGWPVELSAQALGVSADAVTKRLRLAHAYIAKREQPHGDAPGALALVSTRGGAAFDTGMLGAPELDGAREHQGDAGRQPERGDAVEAGPREQGASGALPEPEGADALPELAARVGQHFTAHADGYVVGPPRLDRINRSAFLRVVVRRLTALCVGVAVIAVAASLIDFNPPRSVEEATPVDTRRVVKPPGASGRTFGPFADGKGGFVSMNAESGALFSNSVDGVDWRRESLWNFRAVDIRLIMTDFIRTGGRYAVTLEPLSPRGGTIPDVAPRIAISQNLDDWQLYKLDPGQFPEIPGVDPSIDVVGVAAAGANLLASVRVDEAVDYRSYDIGESDVCVFEERNDRITLHLCTGDVIDISETTGLDPADTFAGDYLYLSENGEQFVAVDPPALFDPYGLFGFGERFGVFDRATGVLSASDDGRTWQVIYDLATESRLGLAAGSDDGDVMMINPAATGWTSHLWSDGSVRQGDLPIALEPEAIWLKPQIVNGPAGWAMFVTTSRPWERLNQSEFGWALRTGDWIASQLPGSGFISLRAIDGSVGYRYAQEQALPPGSTTRPAVTRGMFGGVRLFRPGTDQLLVEISGDRIRESRVADAAGTEAETPADASGEAPRLVTSDGFALAGDIAAGPIIVTAPDGTTTEYADGFAFTNGDTRDGVETDVFSNALDPTFRFFDSTGRLEFEIAAADLDIALRPAGAAASPGRSPRAFIFFSSDGVKWRTIWQSTEDTWYATVAVGASDVLLTAARLTEGPIVIPLDG